MNNVLLVEDEIIIADGVEVALRDDGIEVLSAHSAGEALRRLEAEPRAFAVLVTDINLGPGANGFEVAAIARVLNPEIRIVYITGRRENIEAAEEEALICLKPFDAEGLARQVKDILRGEKPFEGRMNRPL
jgi:DNA-binding NtrC family response regulator